MTRAGAAAVLVEEVDEGALVVALEAEDGGAAGVGRSGHVGLDVGEGVAAVDLGTGAHQAG